jgi:hypothetical protein
MFVPYSISLLFTVSTIDGAPNVVLSGVGALAAASGEMLDYDSLGIPLIASNDFFKLMIVPVLLSRTCD